MRKCIQQSIILLLLTAALAVVLYCFTGPVDRRVHCVQSKLADDYLCLATVMAEYQSEVLWVDARDAKSYSKHHVPGALLIPENDVEKYLSKPEVMQAIGTSDVEGQVLVIYCGSEACGGSKHVAHKIRATGFHSKVFILHGGWKALVTSALMNGPS